MSLGRRRSPLPSNWPTLKRLRHELDDWTCQSCGHHDPTGATLECDHTRTHDYHGLDGLQTLCRKCHATKTGKQANRTRHSYTQLRKRPTQPHPGLTQPT